jgi:hypothetical protein
MKNDDEDKPSGVDPKNIKVIKFNTGPREPPDWLPLVMEWYGIGFAPIPLVPGTINLAVKRQHWDV